MGKLHYFLNQRYSKLKSQCEKEKKLFVDPEFPAENKSLFFSRSPTESVEWKRPQVCWKFTATIISEGLVKWGIMVY